jgi:hypothetical protein
VAATATALLASGTALADLVPADADQVNAGQQTTRDLGVVAPGAIVHASVTFELVCTGVRHADLGQTVVLTQGTTVAPEGGSISVGQTSIGPIPDSWPDDIGADTGCPSPLTIPANGPSEVTIEAPPVVGDNYEFTVFYDRTLTPAGISDLSSVAGATVVTFILDIAESNVDTTPPVMHDVPTGLELFTSDPNGAALSYTPPTATDEQDPAPVVACDPAPGAIAPVGRSSVACTASDASGNAASASFPVVVHLVTVAWDEPVGDGATLVVQGARTVPVKLRAWVDGVPVRSGGPGLEVRPCGADPATPPEQTATLEFKPSQDRWAGHLQTVGLAFGCHRVALVAGGLDLAGFRLDIQAGSPVAAKGFKRS